MENQLYSKTLICHGKWFNLLVYKIIDFQFNFKVKGKVKDTVQGLQVKICHQILE